MIQWQQRSDSSDTAYYSVVCDQVKTGSSESGTETEELTNHKTWERALRLTYPSAFASDSDIVLLKKEIRSRKRYRKKMERLWFFSRRFRQVYDSAYDSDFKFSLGHKRSYDSDSDTVAREKQPLNDFSVE